MIRDTEIVEKNGLTLLQPVWPAPTHVNAICTTRQGGVSTGPYEQFNLASHVDDNADHVAQNRQHLIAAQRLPKQPAWLEQIHSNIAIALPLTASTNQADASYTGSEGEICTVMTADCLPLLVTDRQGQWVAGIHAGWRGLAAQIITATLSCYPFAKKDLLIWLGPAIGAKQYEVDDNVHTAFDKLAIDYSTAFTPARSGHYFFDVYEAARTESVQSGISREQIYGGGACTFTQADLFYSYRRDGAHTGRMASLIWLASS